jgi:hypothetical protein
MLSVVGATFMAPVVTVHDVGDAYYRYDGRHECGPYDENVESQKQKTDALMLRSRKLLEREKRRCNLQGALYRGLTLETTRRYTT